MWHDAKRIGARVRCFGIPVLYAAVAMVQTAPLAKHLSTQVPFGTYPAATTVRWQLWALWWNSESLANGYAGYWNAPIFHPDPSAFAYSEPQWLTGLAFSAVLWICENPYLSYNLVLLTILTLNGYCGFVLLRRLRCAFWPALCGGVWIEMLPITADQIGLIQSMALFPCAMALDRLIQFSRSRRCGPLLWCALWMAICFHTSSHTALLFGPVLAAGFPFLVARKLALREYLPKALAAAVVTGVLIAPVAIPQMRALDKMDMELRRSEKVIRNTSARVSDYLKMPASNSLRQRPADFDGRALGVGLAVWPLAMAGTWFGLARRRHRRRWTLYCILAATACLLLSFGPTLPQPWVAPYELARDYYPGFRHSRNLWRFAALAQFFVAVLAALGLARLWRVTKLRALPLGPLAALVLAFDWLSAPVPLLDPAPDPHHLEWIEWLRQAPPDSRIVHVRMVASGRADAFAAETYWMNCQMIHGRTMANGFSSFFPLHTKALAHLLTRFPDAASISGLRRLNIDHVLVESRMYDARREHFDIWKEHVVLEKATESMRIYRVLSSGT